ncbi:4'-phosphopantetheinyl transferase superfamily protein [Luteibacter aegosomatis]|uniref:4'-phosphopantetheinyl transferase family protein n=1 Tax=Luteibacter aegosomatis TaxID=2911537 RepID=UPI001FFB1312|nr:4'-phosphopantetheinyl transferase superfamily protein [Luteibacter aegosomatis]UPG83975.1 4'-phosphopantetheinyl transferase superfamily protein [Luteibacter aegosomatis]
MRRLSLAGHPGGWPDAFLLEFDLPEGGVEDFARHGIACPPSVERSVAKRRAEYLAGRRVAVAALREAGADVHDVAIGVNRAPSWPSGFTGSITHASGMAAAVAMPDRGVRGVGIDIENVASESALTAIVQSVVDEDEHRVLDDLARRIGGPMALTVAFSAKESFYKATAATVGRIFEFTALKIVGGDEDRLYARVAEPLASSLPTGMEVAMGYAALNEATVVTSFRW